LKGALSYARADDMPSALEGLRAEPDGVILAGGTTLLDLMKLGVVTPRRLLDITALPQRDPSLATVSATDGGVRIGALARMSDVAEHPLIRDGYLVVSEALLKGASAQLRNMATIGGNLLQRTRCTYYRDVMVPECNKRAPGSGCGARLGVHRLSAVLGTSERCIATHPSDVAVAFVALEAQIHLTDGATERTVAADDFFLLPGDTPWHETAINSGELITAVTLPPLPAGARSHYLKVRDRESYEFALTSAAVAVQLVAGRIAFARLALGGVGTKPWRVAAAEEVLLRQPPTEETFARAAEAALAGATPLTQNAFKVDLAQRTLVRALATVTAAGGAS
jgi:xanthine dehydrogenase YagS FAD-binding subunit